MPRGTVYHCVDFEFPDGAEADKYLVLLNEPKEDEPYIFCTTTSRSKNKSPRPGCDPDLSLFMLKGRHDFFPVDTWLQLFRLWAFGFKKFLDHAMRRKMQEERQLRTETIGQIVNCVKICKDVSGYHRQLVCRKS